MKKGTIREKQKSTNKILHKISTLFAWKNIITFSKHSVLKYLSQQHQQSMMSLEIILISLNMSGIDTGAFKFGNNVTHDFSN